MKFTIAANQASIGGGEVMLFAIAEAARTLGHDVTVVAPRGDVANESVTRNFRTVVIQADSTLDYLAGLRRWDARHRTGLLWCNGLRPAFATSGHADRVVELHQRPVGKLRALAWLATRGARRVVVPSYDMAADIPGSRCLWNWTDPVEVTRTPDGPITVGFLGRLSPDKGVLTLIEAAELLEQRHPGRYRLLLAGESRFVPDAEAKRVDEGIARLGERVLRPGWMDRDDFFARCDIAVFPSLWREPFGLVAAEAMSAKVPFIVSDAGALPEVAGTGWTFPAGDATALANVIERVAEDPNRYVEAGYQRWLDCFSPQAGAARLEEFLADEERPSVIVAHDYLTQRGGAERVALLLAQALSDGKLVTSVYNPDTTFPGDIDVSTSWLDRIPGLRSHFRVGLPLYGLGFSTTCVDADVVVASSTGFAHGIRTRGTKIVYCHSPARFIYVIEDYVGGPWWRTPTGWLLQALRPALRAWDQRAAASADLYVANSSTIAERIRRVYGIEATVVNPPYAIDPDGPHERIALPDDRPFYLVVSRLMPYKNVDVAIDAFRTLDARLLIVGAGPLRDRLAADLPENVTMVQQISDAQLRWAYANAQAVIAPSREDYGLTPVEGFAFGTPALALRAGGYLDTVAEGRSGWFFEEATAPAIREAIARLSREPIDPERVRDYARRFSPDSFVETMRTIVDLARG